MESGRFRIERGFVHATKVHGRHVTDQSRTAFKRYMIKHGLEMHIECSTTSQQLARCNVGVRLVFLHALVQSGKLCTRFAFHAF